MRGHDLRRWPTRRGRALSCGDTREMGQVTGNRRAQNPPAAGWEATLAAMAVGNGRLTPGDRDEILAAAQRALHAGSLPQA